MGIQWTNDFLVGNPTIDRQHKELFRAFGELVDACRLGKGKNKIEELLDFLEVYVIFHFDAEEKLMEQSNYPGREAHRTAHAGFISQLKELKIMFGKDGASMELLITTNETVLRWLIEHIRKTDTALGAYLKTV
ncbi:MAG: hypothetical protein A2091_06710 [Desulfuromonadales bacterium GWD2_61_12]|nr:MAG: hypothetical protein A2005_10095 [Desulfuromonadales bacterium GWC2_61_20]OGR32914.1 MAG: hypothetical protein A2091_06710 [Desulfuromonadales bacterium GWD2_61_12]HAD05185.1 hemerythrin [Desulfuromonas sp.]HBT84263.1 hemerythrin [Desulfuromonas sp.]